MPLTRHFVQTLPTSQLQEMVEQIEAERRIRVDGQVRETTQTLAGVAEAIQATRARNAIMAKWLALGGPKSDVALPLDPAFPIRKEENALIVDFRGGTMKVLDNNADNVVIDAHLHVTVSFEGFGLEMRQESDGDEIYGIIAVAIGAMQSLNQITLPQVVLGPEANNRIYQSHVVLFDGRPNDLSLVLKFFEHDSGDREAIRAETRKRVQQIFQTGMGAVGGGMGGATGTAVNAIGSDSSVNGSLTQWIINGLADGIAGFLGMGDDEYNSAIIAIPYGDMINIPPTKIYHCSADPRGIEYTHSITLTGKDDGGDRGQITVLFKVQQT